jgi:hypothetical protein
MLSGDRREDINGTLVKPCICLCRYAFVKAQDECSICDLQLLMRPFYLFPCGHRFHSDCLLTELNPMLPSGKRNKLHDLQVCSDIC